MLRQSRRFTLVQTSCGSAAAVENARTAACRFDMSSAAGRPLPTTSAIDTATRVSLKREDVVAVAADAGRGRPERRQAAALHVGHRRRQQRALDQPGFVVLAREPRVAAPRRQAFFDFTPDDFDQRQVVPRLLDEAPRAAAHGFDRRVDAAPAGHHDDRQGAVVRSARWSSSSRPSRPDVVSRV